MFHHLEPRFFFLGGLGMDGKARVFAFDGFFGLTGGRFIF